MKKLLSFVCLAAGVAASFVTPSASAQTYQFFTNGSGVVFAKVLSTNITTDQRWTSDKVWILDKLTFVAAPAVLTIEPGTIIRGETNTTPGTGTLNPADPGTLIIARGAKLVANGTPQAPIIFTSMDDPYVPGGTNTIPQFHNGTTNWFRYSYTNLLNPAAIDETAFGIDARWGGVILLGKTRLAVNNSTGTNLVVDPTPGSTNDTLRVGANFVEGFQTLASGRYGGTDDDDNSGVMRYCSIRFGGFVLSPNNEINGLTMGAVGRGTTIEFIEVFNNADDDFEWFGGTVNGKYLAGLFGGDDGFDWDMGFRGKLQYLFHIQGSADDDGVPSFRNTANYGDAFMECDGGESNGIANDVEGSSSKPYSIPTAVNFTLVGRGTNYFGNTTTTQRLRLRANSGGRFYNGILTQPANARMLGVEGTSGGTGDSSFQAIDRLIKQRTTGGEFNFSGDLTAPGTNDIIIQSVLFYSNSGTTLTNIQNNNAAIVASNLTAVGSFNVAGLDPGIRGIGRGPLGKLDPRLTATALARTNETFTPANDGFFTRVSYKGAFRDNNWLKGWSILNQLGVITNAPNAFVEPALLVGHNGVDPTVSFTAQSGFLYSVEKSSDLKTYSPMTVVNGAGSAVTITNTGAGLATPTFYRVIVQ